MNSSQISALALICLSLAATDCTSIQSTLLHRDESNVGWEAKKLDGMPITLKVPTHVRVDVIQTRYLKDNRDGTYEYLTIGKDEVRQFAVERTTIHTEKVFTVDFKRPAAGTLNYTAKLSPADQYFTQVTSSIDDITIEEASKAFERILGALPRVPLTPVDSNAGQAPSGPGVEGAAGALTPIRTVVASEIFDLNDPVFESNVRQFLQQRLTKAQGLDVTHYFDDGQPYSEALYSSTPVVAEVLPQPAPASATPPFQVPAVEPEPDQAKDQVPAF